MPIVPASDTLVITSYPPEWDELAKYTCASHAAYCSAHGYDYHADRSSIQDEYYNPQLQRVERLPIKGFVKMGLFLKFLPLYKYVAWIDADALVTNPSISVASLFEGVERDLVLPFDFNGHNATVIIARSTDLVADFFWACNNTGRKLFLKHDWVEMEAMRYFLGTPPYDRLAYYLPIKRLCGILPQEYLPYVPLGISEKYGWKPGDFILHLSALPLERRVALAKQYSESLGISA